jgi:hypothetical protein
MGLNLGTEVYMRIYNHLKLTTVHSPIRGSAVAQAVSRQLPNAEVQLEPRSVHVGLLVDKVAQGQEQGQRQGQGFIRVLQFSPVINISPRL